MELETFVEGNQLVTRATCATPHTVGSMQRDSNEVVVRESVFIVGDVVIVADAGPEGGDLVAEVDAVAGHLVTLDTPATAPVSRVLVGKLADPGSVTFTDRHRDDEPVVYTDADPEVSNPSVGVWELRRIPDEGDGLVHFQGTTPCHCAADGAYRVKRSRALA